jgi:hypothetical protein
MCNGIAAAAAAAAAAAVLEILPSVVCFVVVSNREDVALRHRPPCVYTHLFVLFTYSSIGSWVDDMHSRS